MGALTIDAEFEMAPASHAPLEVECAIADVRADRAEIWSRLQCPIATQQAIAQDLGLAQDKVKVHVVSSGGSFGRGVFWDGVQQAVQVSKALGRPCKLMYHRTDDMRHARLRPHQYHKCRATLLLGQVISYQQRIASPRVDLRHGLGEMLTATAVSAPPTVQQSIGNLAFEEATFKVMVTSPYNFGVVSKELVPVAIDMNTCTYRSVHIQPARGVEEIMVDEIAAKLNKDPVAFRLEHLRLARARAVLQGSPGRQLGEGDAGGIRPRRRRSPGNPVVHGLHRRDRRSRSEGRQGDQGGDRDRCGPADQPERHRSADSGRADRIDLVGAHGGLALPERSAAEGSYSQYHFARMKHYPKDVQIIIMPASDEAIGGLGEVGTVRNHRRDRERLRASDGHQATQVPAQLPG